MINPKTLVLIGAAACFAGCTGDFLILFILGPLYPGYSQLADTMSLLGATASPVSDIISFWWIILGVLMVLFAVGFRAAFLPGNKYLTIAFWLLILYGAGEGISSGLFKADRVNGSYTVSFIVHDILGGAGVFAILILPLIVQKMNQFSASRSFKKFSQIVVILGILFLLLFSFRFFGSSNDIVNELTKYKGLWQRLLILDFYIYFVVIAVRMVKETVYPKNSI